ncbi:MAG TPA: DNA polymerase/3'-5' exonuclease PolX, partial [Thermoanaerobaculia bacterium]|nr:DNA polymerase/3'-5' exonuclease PolX [Thermoanaerobaculia bacterium]
MSQGADKFAVARALDEISRYLELGESNRFKALAYERAARSLRSLDREPADLIATGDLLKTPGIGKGTAAVIEELVRTGASRYLDDLRKQYPPGIFGLMRVPSLGLKKIGILYETLGIGSLDELEAAARAGKLAALHGFGPKTQQKILEGIEKARRRESQFLLPVGIEVGEMMREQLAAADDVVNAEISGSVRRRLEVIRNVNVVVVTRAPERVAAVLPNIVENVEVLDETTVKGVANGEVDVLFHFAKPAEFGALLLKTTGSSDFVEAFEKLRGGQALSPVRARRQARVPVFHGETEQDVFKNAGFAYVEPERRESADDLKRKRPRKLVEMSDLRGTFHVHTTFSDGRNTVFEMLDAARLRGFEYVGLTDHSKAAFYANGLTEARLPEQKAEIDAQRPRVAPLRVFRGTEADILPDGTIDYADTGALAQFDFVVASVHSRFNMDRDEMTERILRALDNPLVTFLGHLTGRLLLNRDGYTMEFDKVFERAGERGVMIEINGNPNRLDLDWRLIQRALDRGVLFSINPDAHSTAEYNALVSGTWVARKGGLSPRDIFNTRQVE